MVVLLTAKKNLAQNQKKEEEQMTQRKYVYL